MRAHGLRRTWNSRAALRGTGRAALVFLAFAGPSTSVIHAQVASQDSLSDQVQKLTLAMAREQAQIEQSQQQLDEMRQQLTALEQQMSQSGSNTHPAPSQPDTQATPPATASAIEEIRERQAVQESQIATLEQTKVESESKYPVKITGLILMNAFVNTSAVDIAATPTLALPGSGSTGASVRQTVLGLDARGPHLFGARSSADVRVDFDGSSQTGTAPANYTGYYSNNSALLRLRTAHAGLQWDHTRVYFALDRPVFNPDTPTSLTAVAIPPLAWSGNLWTWNPQGGVTQDFELAGTRDIRLQAALTDVGDAPLSPSVPLRGASTATPPTTGEASRWPGIEARVALLGSKLNEEGSHFGVGGYFAPHLAFGHSFDSWAGTLDTRLRLPAHLALTANAYRGLALGGLGGGAYKDFVYSPVPYAGAYYIRPLDDVGGWAQLTEKVTERIELNSAFGIDNVFADELRPYAVYGGTMYQNLARNRTYFGNVIYSPSSYLLFSLEYRHLESSPVIGLPAGSNVIGLGAGYKF